MILSHTVHSDAHFTQLQHFSLDRKIQSLPINQVMIKDVCIQWDYLFYQTPTMTEGLRGTKEACSNCSTAVRRQSQLLPILYNRLTPQINIILLAAHFLPILYVLSCCRQHLDVRWPEELQEKSLGGHLFNSIFSSLCLKDWRSK